ncbi:serine hydrolase [Silanimonas sp.]|uniref:serine hydrolase domain-containing protein n=1 Tax=Silanimonas sp. TaxID=1929290 RepID=UPI0022BB224E|nr:serine hydrolase [Silanimonas sp.]MCZ8166328.1 serine hydrolase [Silanimonas sp.]
MPRPFRLLVMALALCGPAIAHASDTTADASYVPPRGAWAECPPRDCGFDAAKLAEAVAWVQTQENPAPRDQTAAWVRSFGQREPWFGGILGPMAPRGPVSGVVIHRGRVLATFGEPDRVDMSHSITKSALSAVVGLAWQDGRIDPDAPVAASMPPGVDLFTDPKNAPITWEHLLRQTSDWQGTLWGKPDWADRPVGYTPEDWPNAPRAAPGAVYEYNDVRINVLALAALHVHREPLPVVFRERIMDPIGASSRWRWEGYRNSWLALDGRRVQSVSGGGHWGGGLFIDSWDLARFGLLYLREGRWGDRQIVDPAWMARSRTPGTANPAYGHANWFLNTGRKALPSMPESTVYFVGNGMNAVVIDREHDLVVVARWIDGDPALDGFLKRLLAARNPAP